MAELVGYATDGLVDAYIDVQADLVNREAETRTTRLYAQVGPADATSGVNNNVQKVLLGTLDVTAGDELHALVSLTARNGATVRFNGLVVE